MQFGLLWRVVTAVCLLGGGLWLATDGTALSQPSPEHPPEADVAADNALLRADVRADGTADWRVEYRASLDDPATDRAFENLSAAIERDPTPYAERFERRMNETVAAAGNATGREMSVANVSVAAETRQLPRSYGVVVYEFEWRGFAVRDGDRLVADDALAGLFLEGGQALVVTWPEGYALTEVAPAPDERRAETREVVWNGPTDFGHDAPRVAVGPPGGPFAAVGGSATVVAVLAVAVVAVAGGVALARRGALPRWPRGGTTEADGGATAAETGTVRPPPAADSAGDEGRERQPDASDDGVSPELLSNDERVLRALRDNGGRMRQQSLAAELDWTDAKTSQVVGRLREDGRIESFRIGRENVLTLPGDRL